jgi:hypothetical protein
MNEPLFYHGGPPGLTAIEPRSKTGAFGWAAYGDWRRFFVPDYRVYFSEDYRTAALFAAGWAARTGSPSGCVYTVEPGPDLDIDIIEPRSWSAQSAEITGIVGPVRASQLRSLLAWRDQQPSRLANWDEWAAFRDRMIQRALRNGWDAEAVNALLAEAPLLAAER